MLLLASGCGTGELDQHTWVELGTGEHRFVPLADGDDVPLAAGSQGGWHLWVSLRAGGLGDRVRLHTVIEPADWDGPRQRGARPVDLEALDGDAGKQHVGSPAVLSHAPCFEGRPIHLAIELTDDRGRVATDERVVVPRAPPTPEMGECTWTP